jgi:hypothetical protein
MTYLTKCDAAAKVTCTNTVYIRYKSTVYQVTMNQVDILFFFYSSAHVALEQRLRSSELSWHNLTNHYLTPRAPAILIGATRSRMWH